MFSCCLHLFESVLSTKWPFVSVFHHRSIRIKARMMRCVCSLPVFHYLFSQERGQIAFLDNLDSSELDLGVLFARVLSLSLVVVDSS